MSQTYDLRLNDDTVAFVPHVFEKIEITLAGRISEAACDEVVLLKQDHAIVTLSDDEPECAQMLCDKHLCRAAVDYPRILQAAQDFSREKRGGIPDKSHPSVIWAANGECNYHWLWMFAFAVRAEYQYRFDAAPLMALEALQEPPRFPSGGPTVPSPPPQILPFEFRVPSSTANHSRWMNAVTAWREFYIQELPQEKWTKRKPPKWFLDGLHILTTEIASAKEDDTGFEIRTTDKKKFRRIV